MTGFLVETVEQCAQRSLELLDDPALGKALGRRGKEHVRGHFLTPRYLRDYLRIFTSCVDTLVAGALQEFARVGEQVTRAPAQRSPLVLVSNRGPVTFGPEGEVQRGTGGLVTALSGLASHRDAVWIASAMNEHDARVSHEHKARPFPVRSPAGGEYQVRLVVSNPEAYDRFYNVFANPMLWFIQHYLWDLSNAPDIRREEIEAFEFGYNAVNEDLARAVVEEIEDEREPVVMVHDYHLYTLPELVRRARPDVFLHHFVHIPWTQSDSWRVLPSRIRQEIFAGLLANDIIGFHTRSYRRNFLQCCRDLMDLEVDFERGRGGLGGARGVGAGLSAADRPQGGAPGGAGRRAWRSSSASCCAAGATS